MWSAIIASSRKRGSFVQSLIKFFKERVLNDSGVIEAESCLETQLDNLIEGASLVITPNGYKESKLYSIIPEDGSGDFAVTRSGITATRINSDGLVELVPNNFIARSADLEQATWTKYKTTIVSSTYLAPNGSLTAYELVGNSGETYLYTSVNATNIVSNGFGLSTELHNISFYLKYKGLNRIRIYNGQSTGLGSGVYIEVDLSLGIITNTSYGAYAYGGFIEDVGDGWYRVGFITTLQIGASNIRFAVSLGDSVKTIADGIDGVYIWGPQLVLGTEQKSYIPTLTRANYPRIDYSNGSCPTILVEPTATNFFLQSENFEDVSKEKVNTTVTSNTEISPNGFLAADTITATANDGYLTQNAGGNVTNASCNFSVYLKRKTGVGDIILEIGTNTSVVSINSSTWTRCSLLSTVISSTYTISSGFHTITTTVPHNMVTGDRVRFNILTFATGSGGISGNPIITVVDSTTFTFTLGTATATGTSNIYANYGRIKFQTSGDEIYAWGAQLETTVLTSYIPTTTATVTRNADLINRNISSLIGQKSGSIFIEFLTFPQTNFSRPFYIVGSGVGSSFISFYITSNNAALFIDCKRPGVTLPTTSIGVPLNGVNKLVYVYNQTSQKAFLNGVLVRTDIFAEIEADWGLGECRLGYHTTQILNGGVNIFSVFPSQLTDEQAIALTTL